MRQHQNRTWIVVIAWLVAGCAGSSYAVADDWQTFRIDGKFSIDMPPGEPKRLEQKIDKPVGEIDVITYVLALDNDTKAFGISSTEIPAVVPEPQGEEIEQRMENGERAVVAATKAKLLSTKKIKLDGFSGRDFMTEFPDGTIGRYQIFLVHRTVFELQAININSKEVERFFASFKPASGIETPAKSQ